MKNRVLFSSNLPCTFNHSQFVLDGTSVPEQLLALFGVCDLFLN